jgi:hypothetical protein
MESGVKDTILTGICYTYDEDGEYFFIHTFYHQSMLVYCQVQEANYLLILCLRV